MAIETERKFLVKNDDFLPESVGHARIAQGYLSTDPARTVRVRIKGEKAFLTIKGASDPSGVSRGEWEYGIPVEDARELLALCGERIIDKTRYDVPVGSGQHCTPMAEMIGSATAMEQRPKPLKSLMTAILS